MVRMVGAKSGPCQHVCGSRVTIVSTARTDVSRETSGRFRGAVKRFGVVRFGMRSGGALGRIGRGRVRMRLCRARSCRAMRGLFGRVGLVGFVAMVFRCVPPLAVCGAKGAFESSPPSAPYALGWARMFMASCAFFWGGGGMAPGALGARHACSFRLGRFACSSRKLVRCDGGYGMGLRTWVGSDGATSISLHPGCFT